MSQVRALVTHCRGWSTSAAVAYAALLWAIFLVVRAHLWGMFPRSLLMVDEGYVVAFAVRMLHGRWLPYVDAASHRGPVFYFVVAAFFRLFGASATALRVLSLCVALTTLLSTFVAAARARAPFVGAVAALGWVIATLGHFNPLIGLAYAGESLVVAFTMAALACLVHGLGERCAHRKRWFLVAGLAVSLGALAKQTGVVAIVPLTTWLVAAAASRTAVDRRERLRWLAAFGVGLAVPVALLLARYAAAHELRTLYYYTIVYNRDVYALHGLAAKDARQAWTLQHLMPLSALLVLCMALVGRFAGEGHFLRSWDEEGFPVTVVLGTTLVYLVVNASLRDFNHYYLLVLPWAALLAGVVIDVVARPLDRPLPAAAILFVLGAIGAWGWHTERVRFEESKLGNAIRFDTSAEPVCRYLDTQTKAGDPIFVWGFMPSIYMSCERMPASRFVFTTFPSGVVPWLDSTLAEENARAVPGSRVLLLEDLESTKPKIVLDAARSLLGRSMTRYEELARYLTANYCADGVVAEIPAYVRKAPGAACPPPPDSHPHRHKHGH